MIDIPYLFTDNPDCLVFVGFIFNCLRSMSFFVALVKCSEIAHNSMFKAVLKAPIYFFDTNPVGRYNNSILPEPT